MEDTILPSLNSTTIVPEEVLLVSYDNEGDSPEHKKDKFDSSEKSDKTMRSNSDKLRVIEDYLYLKSPNLTERPPVRQPSQYHRCLIYSSSTGAMFGNSFSEFALHEWRDVLEADIFWIDIYLPTSDELGLLKKIFDLKQQTAEEIMLNDPRERLETHNDYTLISYQVAFFPCEQATNKQKDLIRSSLFNILLPRGIILISSRPFGHRKRVLSRMLKLESYFIISPGWIAYAILDESVDSLVPILKDCELEAEKLEDLVLNPDDSVSKESTSLALKDIITLKIQVLTLYKLVTYKLNICKALTKKIVNEKDFTENMQLYLGDVEDHIIQLIQGSTHLEKTLARTHTNYCDFLALRAIQFNNNTFDQTMILTYIGAAVSFLIFVTGYIGVNVNLPKKTVDGSGSQWDFVEILGIAGLISLIISLLARWYANRILKPPKS